MSLTSFHFFCFFGVSLAVYYLAPRKYQWYVLLAFSAYFFLRSSDWTCGIYFVLNVAASSYSAWQCAKAKEQGREKAAKTMMLAGLAVNVAILAVLKYSHFAVYNWNILMSRLGSGWYLEEPSLSAPVGIRFYTLMSIGYILDVYWGMARPEKNPLKMALFTGYYPQMTSGPVSRFEEVKQQLFAGCGFRYENLALGLQRILWGLFKKLVLSSRAAVVPDVVYADPEAYTGLYVWAAAFLFMLQLYTDFSGCMDIVLGASQCYGIKLPENFRAPFFSRSVQEYWQRWHITLGEWLRSYILFPVLRSRGFGRMGKWLKLHVSKKASRQLPSWLGMLIVWLLIGLWHGGAWKYILGMGLWFFGCIVAAQALEPLFIKLTGWCGIDRECFGYRFFQSVRVFFLVSVGNMFFRLGGMSAVWTEIRAGLSEFNPWIFFGQDFVNMGLTYRDQNILVFGVLCLVVVAALQEKYVHARLWMQKQFLPFRWLVWLFLSVFTLIYGTYGPGYDAAEFIYRGF